MYLTQNEREKCEVNKCGKKAAYTVNLSRSGIRSKIHICKACLAELYAILGEPLVPRSIETVRKQGEKG